MKPSCKQTAALSMFVLTSHLLEVAEGQNMFQCYLDENVFNTINMVPVDISYQCCSETANMYAANNNALADELANCVNEVMSYEDLDSYCNHDYTSCTFDYHEFSCDDDFMQSCAAAGGARTEGDIQFRCDDGYGGQFSMRFLNKVDCVAPACSDTEIVEVYRTAAAAMDCVVDWVEKILVDGRDSEITYHGGSPGKASFESEKNERNKGAIVGGVVGALLGCFILGTIIGLACYRSRSASSRPKTTATSATITPLEAPLGKVAASADATSAANVSQPGVKVVKTIKMQTEEPDGGTKVVTTHYNSDGSITEIVEYFSDV